MVEMLLSIRPWNVVVSLNGNRFFCTQWQASTGRKYNTEGAALAFLAGNLQPRLMSASYVFDDCQTQTCASGFS